MFGDPACCVRQLRILEMLTNAVRDASGRRDGGRLRAVSVCASSELRIPRVILDELLPPQPEGLANAAARSRRSGVTSAARRYERDSLRS